MDTGTWPAEVAASAAQLWSPPASVVQAGVQDLWVRTAQRLRAAADDRRQAAGVLMQIMGPGDEPKHLTDATSQAVAALVQLALRTTDGRVVQWALATCQRGAPGACLGLNARHWVRAEPGNVIAWLQLAHDEPDSLDEALHGMTQARYADVGYRALATLVEAALDENTPSVQRMSAVMAAIGIDGSIPIPAVRSLTQKACMPALLADANRRQQCDAIARVMTAGGRDALSWSIGRRLAEWAGWPQAELQRLQDELTLLRTISTTELPISPTQPYSCASVASMRQWMKTVAEVGEMGWLRQQAAKRR